MFKKCTEVGHKIDKLIKRSVCVAAQYKVALILISEKIGNHVSFVFFLRLSEKQDYYRFWGRFNHFEQWYSFMF